MANALELQDFTPTINGSELLRPFHLSFKKGHFYSFIGASGIGKTLILRSISQLHQSYSGEIKKEEISNPAFVFQNPNLIPWLSVEKNIELCNPNKARESEAWLKKMDLWKFKDHKPFQLSGGMQQKVALVRAFLFNPQFILLDEPFSNLDIAQRAWLQVQLQNLWLENKSTIIHVTHDIDEALFLSQQVCLFRKKTASLESILSVPFPFPRNQIELRAHPEYQSLYQQIYTRISEDHFLGAK